MKKNILALAATLLTAGTAVAQGPSELLRFSNYNYGIATARTAGMGGAFTSLGADFLSMSLNPAGIAMYKQGEAGVSFGVRWSDSKNNYMGQGGDVFTKDNRTTFNISSAGVAYARKNFAFGIGMNRLADFNSRSNPEGYGEYYSIHDMFADQLYGIPAGDIGMDYSYSAFYRYGPGYWGAILSYQNYGVDPIAGTNPQEYTPANYIMSGAVMYPSLYRKTEGAINEYTISAGYNVRDVFYIGATLGIQDIYYNQFDTYTEYTENNHGIGLYDNTVYHKNLRQSGAGVNLKVGMTLRPVSWFRIALAYHSPTWTSMSEEYDADMTLWHFTATGSDYYYAESAIYADDYSLRSSSRLLAGLSFTLGKFGMLSADYERVWYNNIQYTSGNFGYENAATAATFKPVDNFRFGIELRPVENLYLRGGYGFSSELYQSPSLDEYGKLQQFSAGIGYRNRRFSVDLAYVNYTQKLQPYKLFDNYSAVYDHTIATEGTVYTKLNNNNIIATVAVRF